MWWFSTSKDRQGGLKASAYVSGLGLADRKEGGDVERGESGAIIGGSELLGAFADAVQDSLMRAAEVHDRPLACIL
jgi:hypothetical protein